MNRMQLQVREFHKAFGVQIADKPVAEMSEERRRLRANLILEETIETIKALGFSVEAPYDGPVYDLEPITDYHFDLAEIADGLTDLKYVVFGTDIELGMDAEKCFDEVHRSNLSKQWSNSEMLESDCIDGRTFTRVPGYGPIQWIARRADGKILKPISYSKADLQSVIDAQRKGE